jgi:hypothetical protein
MKPKKKKGAQPRNQNARKHGYYSEHFKRREQQLLETLDPVDLSAEIELIRVTCARFLRAWNDAHHTPDYEASLIALRAVNLSAQTIGMLLRAQSLTGSPRRDLAEFLADIDEDASDPLPEDPNPFGLVPNAPAPA